jgi:DNA-binding transcriptional LysR family regulator
VPESGAFRVAFVPGVMPDKWLNRWRERRRDRLEAFLVDVEAQRSVLYDGRADMSFVRLPVEREGLHVIPLYTEDSVVVMSAEHLLSVLDTVTVEDLTDVLVNDGPAEIAIESAAAGTGVVVVPASIARLHRRKDVTVRTLVDGAESQVGLAWRTDLDDPRAEEFVGIVRGRTAQSSRGEVKAEPAKKAAKKAPRKQPPPKQQRRPGRRWR